jgi:hypothetical protein
MAAKSFVGNGHKRKIRAPVKNNKFLMMRELITLTCCSEELFIKPPSNIATSASRANSGFMPSKVGCKL